MVVAAMFPCLHTVNCLAWHPIDNHLCHARASMAVETLNQRLPLKNNSHSRQTLAKHVSDDSQHFIFRPKKNWVGKNIGREERFCAIFVRFLRSWSKIDLKIESSVKFCFGCTYSPVCAITNHQNMCNWPAGRLPGRPGSQSPGQPPGWPPGRPLGRPPGQPPGQAPRRLAGRPAGGPAGRPAGRSAGRPIIRPSIHPCVRPSGAMLALAWKPTAMLSS